MIMDTHNKQQQKKYPKGRIVGIWMALSVVIFSCIAIPLSIVSDNYGLIGIGPSIGVAIGLAIRQSIEQKYEKQGRIRPLTEQERKATRFGITTAIIIFVVLAVIFLLRIIV